MTQASVPADPTTALLLRAVQRRFGAAAQLDNVVLPTLGGSNRTTVFDVVEGGARRRLVSRQETFTSPTSPFLTPSHQFALLRLAHAHGVPVPEPVFEFDAEDGLGRGYVTAFVAGESMPKTLLTHERFAGARERMVSQAGEILARLHALPTDRASFLAEQPDSQDPLRAQLDRLDTYAEAHPAIELGVRWLVRHRPPARAPQVVHGDFRTGNLLVSERGIEAVLDWECAHLGSGHEDLGWLCMRSWRFGQVDRPVGGFGDRARFYAAYAAASGTPVDPDEVRWWEVFGLVRWAILNVMQAYGHAFGGRRSVAFAACGRNTSLYEYDLLMTLAGRYS